MLKLLIKKTCITSIIMFGILFSCFGFCVDTNLWDYGILIPDFPYSFEGDVNVECDDTTDLWNCVNIKKDERGGQASIIRRLLWVFGLDTSMGKDLKFIDYLKAIINMALWLISFIALIVTIYTFYMVIFSKDEEWIKKAKWTLYGIFVALAIIWLAWIIISFIFRWYQSNWKNNEEQIQTGDIYDVWEFY